MTQVTVYKNRKGIVFGFEASGHASKNLAHGNDIYCAAISAVTQTACIGLESVARTNPSFTVRDGFLSAFVNKTNAEGIECQTVFSTLILGLRAFNEANPGYLQIFEEVQE